MLSICIPIYNYPIAPLVAALHAQAREAGIPFEIVAIEDGSTAFLAENEAITRYESVRYEVLNENIGRAAIRNLLAQTARYPYLLFMDSDAMPPDSAYIRRYLPYCNAEHSVVYGGRCYTPTCARKDWYLRWHYGVERESPLAALRRQHPNQSFITFNFLVQKALFERLRFDASLTGYGHEDTAFGLALQQLGYTVTHLDNPLIHIGLEDAPSFLNKTETGIKNLWVLYQTSATPQLWQQHVKLLRVYIRLKRWGVAVLLAYLFPLLRGSLRRHLFGSRPHLFWFDVYKLLFLCAHVSA